METPTRPSGQREQHPRPEELIEAEPIVAFEADHFDWYEHTAWSVVVKGKAARVTDRDEVIELLEGDLDSWQHRKPFFVRIVPSMTTGRRFAVRRRVEP